MTRRRARNECRHARLITHSAGLLAVSPSPSPSPSLDPSVLEADPITTIAAIVAILFALAAAVIGYRVIRGGRGL